MNQEDPVLEAAKQLGLTVSEKEPSPARQLLVDKINELLTNDFHRLVTILYRMDVSETKLRQLLKDNPGTDAGLIIADMIIERQAQKIRSRKQFGQRDNIDEEEKW